MSKKVHARRSDRMDRNSERSRQPAQDVSKLTMHRPCSRMHYQVHVRLCIASARRDGNAVMKPVYKPAIYFFPLLGCLRQQTIINNGGWQHVLAPHRITPIHVEDNRPAGWCKNSAALAACTLGVHCASTRAASDYTQADAASGCRL